MHEGDTIYNSMVVQAGVIPDEVIARLHTEALSAEARALGFAIANVEKVYQQPVDKALRSKRDVVKDNLPPLVTKGAASRNEVFSLYSATLAEPHDNHVHLRIG